MDISDERISELIAAAVAGELSPDEEAELDALRQLHPGIAEEIASLRGVAARLSDAEATWTEVAPDDALRDRLRALFDADGLGATASATSAPPTAVPPAPASDAPTGPEASAAPVRRPSRWVVGMLGAAACVGIGLGAGLLVPAALSAPPTGPPGTLGAVEPVEVRDASDGTAIDADLVAHTWGTEAVLDATGLEVGATYAIVFIGTDGSEFSAGEMLGSPVAIHCRVNAAVLREDVARLEIRDDAGIAIAAAEVPDV